MDVGKRVWSRLTPKRDHLLGKINSYQSTIWQQNKWTRISSPKKSEWVWTCLEHDFAIEICPKDSAPSQGFVISNLISSMHRTPRPIWVCETVSEGAICFGLTAMQLHCWKMALDRSCGWFQSNQNALVSKLVIHPLHFYGSMGTYPITQRNISYRWRPSPRTLLSVQQSWTHKILRSKINRQHHCTTTKRFSCGIFMDIYHESCCSVQLLLSNIVVSCFRFPLMLLISRISQKCSAVPPLTWEKTLSQQIQQYLISAQHFKMAHRKTNFEVLSVLSSYFSNCVYSHWFTIRNRIFLVPILKDPKVVPNR